MARRGLELLFVLVCVAGLISLLRLESPSDARPPDDSIQQTTPKHVTIGGVSLGMTRGQVNALLGPGPHDQWPLGGLNYTEVPPVYVSFDEQDKAYKIAGAQMEFGESLLTQNCTTEQMESVLGAPTSSQKHGDRCGGGWMVHDYSPYHLTVLTGLGQGAPFVLEANTRS